MKSFTLAALLVGTVSLTAPCAGDRSNDPTEVTRPRQEKLEQPFTALESSCLKMLERQVAVFNGTKHLHKVIQGTAGKRLRTEDQRAAVKLADDTGEIIALVSKVIAVLEAEGAAVAFPELWQELRKEMQHVQRRLVSGDVGTTTQAIEVDIIDTLQEMLKALRKA